MKLDSSGSKHTARSGKYFRISALSKLSLAALKRGMRTAAVLVWRLPNKRIILVSLITLLCFGAYVRMLWPDTTKVSAPAFVASSDAKTQIPLEVTVADNDQDLILRFNLHKWLYQEWERIDIQRAEGWRDIELVVNGRSSKHIHNASVDSLLVSEEKGQYAHLSKKFLSKYFSFETDSGHGPDFYVEYTLVGGLHHRSYSSSFISFLYMPVSIGAAKDSLLGTETEVQLKTPHKYILTSSIPDANKIFVLGDGIVYAFKFNRKETEILISLDDVSASAWKDISSLLLTTVFGFALGVIIEKLLESIRS